jgi:hypothetical protein
MFCGMEFHHQFYLVWWSVLASSGFSPSRSQLQGIESQSSLTNLAPIFFVRWIVMYCLRFNLYVFRNFIVWLLESYVGWIIRILSFDASTKQLS